MRRLITKLLLIMLPCAAMAQEDRDSLTLRTSDTIPTLTLTDNAECPKPKRKNLWESLCPNTFRIQYAGSVGLVNMGLGWTYGKKRQWETDIMFGYVPKYDKGYSFFTFTMRQTYVPWTKGLYNSNGQHGSLQATWQPLSCGIIFNSALHGDYWTHEPSFYPDNSYYRFSSKIRIHLFVGERYTIIVPKKMKLPIKEASFTWELSSCDLYIISKAVNSSLSMTDILSLSFGLICRI